LPGRAEPQRIAVPAAAGSTQNGVVLQKAHFYISKQIIPAAEKTAKGKGVRIFGGRY
jgi:hypothetical protein